MIIVLTGDSQGTRAWSHVAWFTDKVEETKVMVEQLSAAAT